MSEGSEILDRGVTRAAGGGGNCIGDDGMPPQNPGFDQLELPRAVSGSAMLLNYGVVRGAGGGGNCIGDDNVSAATD